MSLKGSSQQGFSLLEAILVIALIGIIVAIAVPNLLAARRAAHEGRAVAHIKTLSNVQALYYQSVGKFAIIDDLYKRDFLSPGQFMRKAPSSNGSPSSGATEIISDGFYDYSFKYTTNATGYTLDCDPKPGLRSKYRFFRFRASRVTNGGTTANAGEVILVALPRSTANGTPPTSAYKFFNP